MDLYKRLWKYIRPYMKLTLLAVGCTLVVSATSGLAAWLVKPVLDDIFIKGDKSFLSPLSLAVLVVLTAKGVFSFFQSYLVQYASWQAIRDIRDDLYERMMYLPVKEYNRTTTGKLISNTINDVGQISQLASGAIKGLLEQTFTIVGLLVVIFIRDWKLSIIAVVVFPLAGIFVSKYGKKIRYISRKAQESIAVIVDTLQESLTGHRIVKIFNMEERERDKFKSRNQEFTKLMAKTSKVSSAVSPTMEVVSAIAIALIIFYGGRKVISGEITTGDFFSFTAGLAMLYQPVKALGNLHNSLQRAMAAVERVFEVMDTATEKAAMDTGRTDLAGVKDKIEFKDASFSYAQDGAEVLKGINLVVKRGEVVAFVGGSGSGKTTLVNLLPRFYELEKGSITIDGVDIGLFNLRTLREQMAMVTQDTILFNDTIRNNISYGTREFTEEEVVEAAKAAHAHGFITMMPDGYDSVIGEKGVRLSGGEKQRIAIARALLKNSPILILDEATSALDTESEMTVQKALDNLMKNRTTLVIAHRLSTVINADKIAVMDQGRLVDIGRHAELLEKSPGYKKLYGMQFGRLESENAAVS